MKLIIAGGRDYHGTSFDEQVIANTIDALGGVDEIVSGGASGADALGENYAKAMGIRLSVFPADWKRHGKKAGPVRNAEMAAYADACLLFPGGSGTASMLREATKMGLRVFKAGWKL